MKYSSSPISALGTQYRMVKAATVFLLITQKWGDTIIAALMLFFQELYLCTEVVYCLALLSTFSYILLL